MTQQSPVPVVSIVGRSDSGKTTLMERVIGELSGRGWRVATVKHHVHDFDIDIPGKDSWRHAQAGAVVSMVSGPTKLGIVRRVEEDRSLAELALEAGDVDILLAEGYKQASDVRIEVSRDARSSELVCEPDGLFAVVTDGERAAGGVPVFGLDDATGVADLIESAFLTTGRE